MLAVLTPEPLDTSGPASGFLGAETGGHETESTQLPCDRQGPTSTSPVAATTADVVEAQGEQGWKNGVVATLSTKLAVPPKQQIWPSTPSAALPMSEVRGEKGDVLETGAKPQQNVQETSFEDTTVVAADGEGIVTAREQKLAASSSTMAIYVRLTESLADTADDSDTESSLGGSDTQRKAAETAITVAAASAQAASPSTQGVAGHHQQHHLQAAVMNSEQVDGETGDVVCRDTSLAASQESELAVGGQREERSNSRPVEFGMPPITRQGAMSDLWQHQGAFRSNQQSMKSMFEEVRLFSEARGVVKSYIEFWSASGTTVQY